jgi:hypothetical protein
MAQATNVSTISPARFHNDADPALANSIDHAALKGAAVTNHSTDLPIEHDQYSPEAFDSSCRRCGVDETQDALAAINQEMEEPANAINAASVNSIPGLRAKALVAFWKVAPIGAGNTEFSFEHPSPFQHLFMAVAELCGLKDKMAATGYQLPDITMVDDDDFRWSEPA